MKDMDDRQRAEELQMEAGLSELGVVGPDGNLVREILAAAKRGGHAAPQVAARPSQWLVAAAVLIGAAVVGTVAWMRSHDQMAVAPIDEPGEQDPVKQDPAPKPKPKVAITYMADYSDNRIVAFDAAGKVLHTIDDLFGVWDVELLPNSHLLVTEFSVSRVRELTRAGEEVWSYTKLKNPYCATRLKNGNTLIADTFAGRIVEVRPDGTEFWSYGLGKNEKIRPFDVEQTDKGTFLISDVLNDRVFEIDYHGNIIWQCNKLSNVHDADRLKNGNTLVTLRNKGEVREIDRDGKVVWRVKGLSSPSDADRLPNGNTLIAENTQVREFDKDGKEVSRTKATWAVEANRYYR